MKKKKVKSHKGGIPKIEHDGRHVLIHGIKDPKKHAEYVKTLRNEYPKIVSQINELIKKIQSEVVVCNPIDLLCFSADMSLSSIGKHMSEFTIRSDEIGVSRMTEYIQSILVSSPNLFSPEKEKSADPSEAFFSIQNDIEKLYELIHTFYVCLSASIEIMFPDYDLPTLSTVLEAQTLFGVRGQRYQAFETSFFSNLLREHNTIFSEIFGMSAEEIISGIGKLQHALSQGKADTLNHMMDIFEDIESGLLTINDVKEEDGAKICDELFGTKLRNVISITGWKDAFVKALSYELGEDTSFFSASPYEGWPIIDLPVQKRPFVQIGNDYFCFDYYTFSDNIYRSIQKATSRQAPQYIWADNQQLASEKMVEGIFQNMLPGCQSYRSNYYPKNSSAKQMAENDLVVLYSKTLLIVEIKAGSFVYTAPITDFEAHIRSYKNLIEKADWQCKRTYDYLSGHDHPILYDENKSVKCQLNMQDISDIYLLSITVDNINDFAAKAEKLNFLNLQCNAISISVDDLMVYQNYFFSPLMFLHFLKHRKLATQNEQLALNDELDHLGMYMEHNYYTFQAQGVPKNVRLVFHGYREKLDHYFNSLYHPSLVVEKPCQKVPALVLEMIALLENKGVENRESIANYLLDFSTEAKNELCERIAYTKKRQTEINHMLAIHTGGTGFSLRYTCFVNQPGIVAFSLEEKNDYVLATIVQNQEDNRMLIDVYFDSQGTLIDLHCRQFTPIDIPNDRFTELKYQGETIAKNRLDSYKHAHPGKLGKIGRNQLCPCASGKKYKRCCGKI